MFVDVAINGHCYENDRAVAFVFKGDTYSYKDQIKALGAEWGNEYPCVDRHSNYYYNQPCRWALFCSLEKMVEVGDKIMAIGAWIHNAPSDHAIATRMEYEEEKEKDLKSILRIAKRKLTI